MTTALLSVFNKTDAFREFARGLHERNISLLASSGTKKFLDKSGIPSRDIADIVGPPIFGHRVVTLSREVYAAILARHWDANDMQELSRLGLPNIGIVYVDLYPLAQAIGNLSKSGAEVREMIDIGGPTLLRAAAKAELVVVSREVQFSDAFAIIDRNANYRTLLAHDAEHFVSEYTLLTSQFYASLMTGEFEVFRRQFVPTT